MLACLLAPCRAATPARLPLTFEAIESLGPDSQSIMSLLLFDPGAKRILQRYTATGKHGGLNHGSVYSLYQQPDHGPLWIGTAQGLNRLHHPAGKLASIRFEIASANFVNAIAPGRGGMLWLGTGASLMRYDPASGSMRRYVHDEDQPHSRTINEASTVLEDSRGRVWVGEFFGGAGLDMMSGDDGRFQHFRHDPQRANSISSDKITCLYEDRYGTVWVGTARGLNRMVPGADGKPTFKRYTGPGDPGPVLIESIESDWAGDECLRQVAHMLGAGVQRAADVAARYGGEEFAFIAPLDNAAQAAELADRIRASIQARAIPHARSPLGCVTVSIGVAAVAPGDKQSPETLLRAADQALYRAKEAGRNCVMQTQLGRAAIVMSIADAL